MAEAAEFPSTRSAPGRRWLRRTAVVLAGVPLLAGLLQLPGAPATGPWAAPAAHAAEGATGSRTVDVAIESMTPSAPAKGDTITISGSVTNGGGSTVTDARVGLRVGAPLGSRSSIESAAERTGFSAGADGQEVADKRAVTIDKLAPGISRDFTLSVPAEELNLGADGVYQLGVTLTGRTDTRSYPQVLGIERTFLPWQPAAGEKKTEITFLWPLISTTRLTARTASDEQQTRTFRDDSLAQDLAPGGRLQQMVALGKDRKVTWVIDPDLLAAVDAMAKSYQVETPTGDVVPGRNQAVAKQWLADLLKALEGREVVALPFADPDLASLAHRGRDVYGALSHLKPATDLAATVVETTLGIKPRTDFAWPVNGAIDSSIVDVATSAGAHQVIARSDSLTEGGDLAYTPTAARPIGSGNTAVVADALLSTAFEGDMARAENATLAVQEFLAQSMMINAQAPDKQRSIVVAPQRMPTASQARAMATALQTLENGRWSQPKSLGDAARAAPDPGANREIPDDSAYPEELRAKELPTSTFEQIQRTRASLEKFQVVLTQPERVVTPFGNAIMREMSTSWRGQGAEAADFRSSVQSYLTGLTQEVNLIQKSTQTLSGRSATIPVTVQNNLVQGIKGLRLVLTSSQPQRLEVSDPQPVRIAGTHNQTVKFSTTANANGPVQVKAQLYTEDGEPYGRAMEFQVNVTEITSTVMLVIAGGVLLLVLAGVRMYTQRKRAAARTEAADGGDPADPADPAGDRTEGTADSRTDGAPEDCAAGAPEDCAKGAPEGPDGGPAPGAPAPAQPSDATLDTGPESGGPSGRSEKVDR
ncbi:DUF6049 family protein [Streptomyces sp. URMC 123]|uniref:DUF6049 family protein n=1 Tax=Streptomyces sp. URMC 123 TaxID=3423403 RepID=UPI003F1AD820